MMNITVDSIWSFRLLDSSSSQAGQSMQAYQCRVMSSTIEICYVFAKLDELPSVLFVFKEHTFVYMIVYIF